MQPSQVLLRFFQSGGEDQRSRVVERATAAAQHLFPDVVQCGGHEFSQPVMARERRNEVPSPYMFCIAKLWALYPLLHLS